MAYPETLELWFEQPAPDDHWGQLVVAATQPGNFCHVEALLPRGFFSSRPGSGCGYIKALDPAKQWTKLDTGLPLTTAVEMVAESRIGDAYDWWGDAECAVGRAYPRPGRSFCSGACYELVLAAGGPVLGSLPSPNLLYAIMDSWTHGRGTMV